MEPSSSSPLSNESPSNLEAARLNRLSSDLEKLLTCEFTDADIIIIEEEAHAVGVHRCILARCKFFFDLFKKDKESSAESEDKPTFRLKDLVPHGNVGREAFLHILHFIYTYKLKSFPIEVSTCVDTVCALDSCKPAIDFDVELMYASHAFQIPELVSSFQV